MYTSHSVAGYETKYIDPKRNYGVLYFFYQMIIITSIHFTIPLLAFYLD